MKIYKTINEISVANYYRIIENNDFNYLIKGYEKKFLDKNKKPDVSPIQKIELENIFKNITDKFNAITAESKDIKKKQAEINILYLKATREGLQKILKIFEQTSEVGVLDLLNDFEFVFDNCKLIDSQIKMVLQKIKGLNNKIKIEESNFDKKYKLAEEQGSSFTIDNLNKRAVYVSVNLQLAYIIDIEKTSLAKWIILNQMNNNRIEQQNKTLANGKV